MGNLWQCASREGALAKSELRLSLSNSHLPSVPPNSPKEDASRFKLMPAHGVLRNGVEILRLIYGVEIYAIVPECD